MEMCWIRTLFSTRITKYMKTSYSAQILLIFIHCTSHITKNMNVRNARNVGYASACRFSVSVCRQYVCLVGDAVNVYGNVRTSVGTTASGHAVGGRWTDDYCQTDTDRTYMLHVLLHLSARNGFSTHFSYCIVWCYYVDRICFYLMYMWLSVHYNICEYYTRRINGYNLSKNVHINKELRTTKNIVTHTAFEYLRCEWTRRWVDRLINYLCANDEQAAMYGLEWIYFIVSWIFFYHWIVLMWLVVREMRMIFWSVWEYSKHFSTLSVYRIFQTCLFSVLNESEMNSHNLLLSNSNRITYEFALANFVLSAFCLLFHFQTKEAARKNLCICIMD